MKILFLCHHYPYPPNHGARIRAFNFIKYLSQRHSVTVATLAHNVQEVMDGQRLENFCDEVIVEIVPSSLRWARAFWALRSSEPSSVAYFRSPRLQARINKSLEARQFDAIIVFCAFMAQYVIRWRQGSRILDYGDIDSAKWLDYSRHKGLPFSWCYGLEAKKLRSYEQSLVEYFHHCTVISQGEFEEFERFNSKVPCTIVPNGVDTEYFAYSGGEKNSASTIVFVGRMDYFPNVDGIGYFVGEIFPRIRERLPHIELCIVGSNPTKAVRNLAKAPNVSLTGYVPDVRCYLGKAAVSIAPLRIARGTQNKILEAMAMGVPTVATPEAAKGVQCLPGRDLLVAGGPAAFASQVIEVIENSKLRNRLAEAGRRQVEQVHTWEGALKILDAVVLKLPPAIEWAQAKPGRSRSQEPQLSV